MTNPLDVEVMINQLEKWLSKEKSLRKRIHLENSVKPLKEYFDMLMKEKQDL